MKNLSFFVNLILVIGVACIIGCQLLFKGLLKLMLLTALNYLACQQEKHQKNSNHVQKYLPWLYIQPLQNIQSSNNWREGYKN